jgi:hypothetical protein
MTKLLLFTILIVCNLNVDGQIHQSSPFEQKLMVEYLAKTDNLLLSVSDLLIDSKAKIKYLNDLNLEDTQTNVRADNLLQKLKWFESSYNVKLKKQTIFQNSSDVVLRGIKVVSVFYTETSNLYNQILSFNNELPNNNELPLIQDFHVTTKGSPNFYQSKSKGILKLESLERPIAYKSTATYSVEVNKEPLLMSMGPEKSSNYTSAARSLSDVITSERRLFSDIVLTKPTSVLDITNEFYNKGMTLFDVGNKINASLEALQYRPDIFINTNNLDDGFLILTGVEQFTDGGYCLPTKNRWNFNTINLYDNTGFSLWAIIKSLYSEQVGHYRLFLFHVKKGGISTYKNIPTVTVSSKGVASFLSNLVKEMPSELQSFNLDNIYTCKVLIFEFERSESKLEPEFVTYSNLKPETHLENSKFYEKLRHYLGINKHKQ